jgi:hypothetical protein
MGEALRCLGVLALLDGTYGEARQHLEESIAVHRELKMPYPLALIGLAYAAHGEGLRDEAVRYLAEGLRTADWMGAFEPQMHALAAMAGFLLDRGEPEQGDRICRFYAAPSLKAPSSDVQVGRNVA